MKILGIETSCDETAIAILEAKGNLDDFEFNLLSNVVSSQVKIHAEYGGVVPNLANREHQRNLLTVLEQTLEESKLQILNSKFQILNELSNDKISKIKEILNREAVLLEQFLEKIPKMEIPDIDAIAVTIGPGLEPALLVGINFARALSLAWDKPIVAVNHMEGHILAALLPQSDGISNSKFLISNKISNDQISIKNKDSNCDNQTNKISFPAIALLVSGGHTQTVLMKDWMQYEIIGQTRDDAVGEAFDKVTKILGLGYPGGPKVSAEAEKFLISNSQFLNQNNNKHSNSESFKHLDIKNSLKIENRLQPDGLAHIGKFEIELPRPMLHSNDFDFSFSGLKTAVLYKTKELNLEAMPLDEKEKFTQEICYEFQQACIDVLIAKTKKAIEKYGAKTLIVGGGVSANKELREQLQTSLGFQKAQLEIFMPEIKFTGDNGAMIAVAGYFHTLENPDWKNTDTDSIKANGNLNF